MARVTSRLGFSRFEADELYKEGLDAYKKKDLETALIKIGQAIELAPGNSEYHATRGFIHLQHGLPDKAREDFETAAKIHPYEMLAHYGRGMIAYQSKNWDEALAYFNDAWAVQPERGETLYYMALVHHRKENNTEALQWMQQAQATFEQAGDRRRIDAGKWIREFEKLLERQS